MIVGRSLVGRLLDKRISAPGKSMCTCGAEPGLSAPLEVQPYLILAQQVYAWAGQAWEHGGYSDDLIVAAQCNRHGLRILCPAFALFPQWCACQGFLHPLIAGWCQTRPFVACCWAWRFGDRWRLPRGEALMLCAQAASTSKACCLELPVTSCHTYCQHSRLWSPPQPLGTLKTLFHPHKPPCARAGWTARTAPRATGTTCAGSCT